MSTVRIAGAPISWGVCEVPGWGHQMGPDRVLTEMAALGLEAMEFGPLGFLPEDAEGRKATLAKHNMSAVGGFFPVVLHDPGFDPLPSIEKELEAYVAADAEVLVLAAETGLDGYDAPRPEMAEENWQTMATNLTRISDYASSRGIIAVIHPHAGTMVETKADVDEVLARTSMPFCLDTGHMWIGGTDPVAFAKDHGDRVGHVHFKDVRLRYRPARARWSAQLLRRCHRRPLYAARPRRRRCERHYLDPDLPEVHGVVRSGAGQRHASRARLRWWSYGGC